MKKYLAKKGFSMIEIVLVIGLLGILMGMSVLYYRSSQVRADINSQAENIVHYLRLAQSNAASGLNNESHGIHFEEDSYTLFHGESYDEEDSENETKELPSTMTIGEIDLAGGEDVIFSLPDGETENYGTIALNSQEIDKTITITITQIGTINY